jgi:PAS domain S-box-containing protein
LDSKIPPNFAFLQDVFGHLPLLVVRLTIDGIVLGVNEEVTRLTGYAQTDLLSRNWWGMMFPGKLFRQVPKFISAAKMVENSGVLRDVPMVIATRDGSERTVAWTRFLRSGENETQELVLIGLDLTDRLTNADRDAASAAMGEVAGEALVPSLAEEIEGSFVTPIQASPPKLAEDHGQKAIQEVHDFLTQVDTRIDALEGALMMGELGHVVTLADQLRSGAHACGLLNVSSAASRVFNAAAQGSMGECTRRINDLVGLCRGRSS